MQTLGKNERDLVKGHILNMLHAHTTTTHTYRVNMR